jgi:hypothetical protein
LVRTEAVGMEHLMLGGTARVVLVLLGVVVLLTTVAWNLPT